MLISDSDRTNATYQGCGIAVLVINILSRADTSHPRLTRNVGDSPKSEDLHDTGNQRVDAFFMR